MFISWLFYGFVLFTIYRELIFFTTMRQAYMLSPIHSTRISARTVLIQTIPAPCLNESALRRVFDHVKRVWIPTDTSSLDDLVAERDKIAMKLEAAEVKLIRTADKARTKQQGPQPAAADPTDPERAKEAADRPGTEAEGESGSVAARWLPRDKRPAHRLKPLIGAKVDTIDWCRGKLAELNPRIEEMQAAERAGEGIKLNSAFIEFTSQSAAQVALQTLMHHKPLHMAPRYIGLTPAEIVWSNMKLQWWERLVKFAATTSFVIVLVVFWSIPVAIVGIISQINFLVSKVPFLAFINDIPEAILGLITGLLPVVMLAVLMALLPIILRLMARISGLPSLSLIELRVQNSYFLFQVIQVFLVTTMTSAASAVVTKIIDDPASAPGLLAESLPAAANFYISFLILQGLSISAGALAQASGVVMYKLLGMLLDNTPRKMFQRWSSLTGIGWGTVFPVYTNLCVIALTYSIIAPIVLGFATVAFGLLYFAYRYNFLFVYNIDINTNGMVYPRALYQSLTGVYLGQICLVGLFGVSKAPGPAILQLVFLVATILFQLTLSSAVQPLLEFLPKNLQAEEEALLSVENGDDDNGEHKQQPVAGAAGAAGAAGDTGASASAGSDSEDHVPTDAAKPGLIARFLHPERYESYRHMRKRIPQDFPEVHYTPETERDAYYNPSITARPPAIWLPRDPAGISAQEVAHTSSVNPCSDQGALVTSDGKIVRLDDAFPPDYIEKPLW